MTFPGHPNDIGWKCDWYWAHTLFRNTTAFETMKMSPEFHAKNCELTWRYGKVVKWLNVVLSLENSMSLLSCLDGSWHGRFVRPQSTAHKWRNDILVWSHSSECHHPLQSVIGCWAGFGMKPHLHMSKTLCSRRLCIYSVHQIFNKYHHGFRKPP